MGHLDSSELSIDERALIEELTTEYGRGYFFPSAYGRALISSNFLSVAIPKTEIDENFFKQFVETIDDDSYPKMRNGIHYYLRSDYDHFLLNQPGRT